MSSSGPNSDPPAFPAVWIEHLLRNVPAYGRLSAADRDTLQHLVLAFLKEKRFEGCGGLEITDEIRVTIAGQACLLLLNLNARFSKLRSILVYPDTFVPKRVWSYAHDGVGDPGTGTLGESWSQGAVVLSWRSVLEGAADPTDGRNLVLHEFAHQLDQEDGSADGIPLLRRRSPFRVWADVLRQEHAALAAAVERGDETVLDSYGATNRAEFFAVATETFFERPHELSEQHPAVYEMLRRYYGQDPAGAGARDVGSRITAGAGGSESWTWSFRLQIAAVVLVLLVLYGAMVHVRTGGGPWLTNEPGVRVIGYPPSQSCAVDAETGMMHGRVVSILGRDREVVGYRVQRSVSTYRGQPAGIMASHDVRAEGVRLIACSGAIHGR
jgi:MtfA peptidase